MSSAPVVFLPYFVFLVMIRTQAFHFNKITLSWFFFLFLIITIVASISLILPVVFYILQFFLSFHIYIYIYFGVLLLVCYMTFGSEDILITSVLTWFFDPTLTKQWWHNSKVNKFKKTKNRKSKFPCYIYVKFRSSKHNLK